LNQQGAAKLKAHGEIGKGDCNQRGGQRGTECDVEAVIERLEHQRLLKKYREMAKCGMPLRIAKGSEKHHRDGHKQK